MIYLKDKITGNISKVEGDDYLKLSENIRNQFDEAAQVEADNFKLQQAKDAKLVELKQVRDATNILPIDTLQGYEIVDDVKTSDLVTFRFLTAPTNNTATDPNNLLFKVLLTAANDPTYYLPYSCLIFNGDGSTRKGYVAIDGALANSLASHFGIRSTNNIKVCNDIENQILAATSLNKLGDININYNNNLTRFLETSTLDPVS